MLTDVMYSPEVFSDTQGQDSSAATPLLFTVTVFCLLLRCETCDGSHMSRFGLYPRDVVEGRLVHSGSSEHHHHHHLQHYIFVFSLSRYDDPPFTSDSLCSNSMTIPPNRSVSPLAAVVEKILPLFYGQTRMIVPDPVAIYL